MTDPVVMQSAADFCPTGVSGMGHLRNFAFLKAVVCTYASVAGILVTGLFVYGAVSLSLYIRTGSVVIPAVLLLLTGGAILPFVASPGVGIAAVLLLTVGGGAFAVLYYSYSQ